MLVDDFNQPEVVPQAPVSDKKPEETWIQYYARIGKMNPLYPNQPAAPSVAPGPWDFPDQFNQPVKEADVPAEFKDNPFVVFCPYDESCGYMEARDFPVHVKLNHTDNLSYIHCPICFLFDQQD